MSSTPAATPVAATYTIEPAHSSAHFKVRHLMIANVRGEFSKVGGTVTVDPSNPAASSITAEIDVNSIKVRIQPEDHARVSRYHLYPLVVDGVRHGGGTLRAGLQDQVLAGQHAERISHPVSSGGHRQFSGV